MLRSLLIFLLKKPITHFIVIGFIFYGIFTAFQSQAPQLIVLSNAELMQIKKQALKHEISVKQGVELWVYKRLLVEYGIENNVHDLDPIIMSRLIKNMNFIGEQAPAEQLLDRAIAMNFLLDDPLVFKRLAQQSELILRSYIGEIEISQAEVEQYLKNNHTLNLETQRFSFEQKYLGELSDQEVAVILQQLNAGKKLVTPQLDLPSKLQFSHRRDIKAKFGAKFAADLEKMFAFDAKQQIWRGPIMSNYGAHVFRALPTSHLKQAVRVRQSQRVKNIISENKIKQEVRQFILDYANNFLFVYEDPRVDDIQAMNLGKFLNEFK